MTPSSSDLSEVDCVRKRPGMYLGGVSATGLNAALFEFVSNSFDEYVAGAATKISIDIDGRWATVEDDGRGIPADLMHAFISFHSGATLDGHLPHVHVRADLRGVGLAPVTAVAERLEVETRRDGVARVAVFSRGRIVEPVRELGPTSARGTRVRFLFDEQIFTGGVGYDLDALEKTLESLARLCPQLDILLQGKSLRRPEGLTKWLRELAPEVIPGTILSTRQTVDDVDVEVVFGWRPRTSASLVRAFANYAETVETMSSNRRGVITAVSTYVRAKRGSKGKSALNGLVAIVHVGLQHPKFGGPTRSRLENEEVEKAVNRVVMNVINSSPQWWHTLHEAMR